MGATFAGTKPNPIREAKRNFDRMKKAERQALIYDDRGTSLWARIRCFWTWPFGHRFERSAGGVFESCVACKHEIDGRETY